MDERDGRAIVQYIPEERESREDPNDISSREDSWPELVADENVEEEVENPLPNIGVPPLEDEHVEEYDVAMQNLEEAYPSAKAELIGRLIAE
ncbi:hypothetical protein H6P81_002937 [Aristolochia fimbriata]|uniref:Uncharacterized protein n=1 Tax=Aristolochia fimbriata TaxID=158543 RepID=A0AAV7FBQ9_ARIFI|nr:hypothetical protein H6P81_002937 [Aristolochia fimbriata]